MSKTSSQPDHQCHYIDGCEGRHCRATPEHMPILGTVLLLPMRLLNEQQAQANHGQSLARLAQRGGLSLAEAACIASSCKFGSMTDERAHELLKRAAQRL
jgi:hypothetical protein